MQKSKWLASWLLVSSLMGTMTGCLDGQASDIEDQEYDDKASLYADGSPEANAILKLVNDYAITAAILRSEAGLATRPSNNLIARRSGADGLPQTADDKLFTSIAQVDAVSYVGPAVLKALKEYAYEKGYNDAANAEVIFSPQPVASSHTARVAKLIDEAEHSIDIAMYSYSDAAVGAALERAVERGVKVRFIFETAGEDKSLTGTAKANSKSGKLERIGVDVRYVNKIMHHKTMIVDGPRDDASRAATAQLVTGSGNWSYGGASVYDENTIFLSGNASLAAEMQTEFNYMWDHSRDFSLETTLPFELSTADLSGIPKDPDASFLVTSANFTLSDPTSTIFRTDWEKMAVSDAWVEAIKRADTSIYVASGHLRLKHIAEALIAAKQQNPALDIKVYVDQQEFISAAGELAQKAEVQECLAGADTPKEVFECENKEQLFAKSIGDAGIDVRYKSYAYRWNNSYADQMHNKLMIIDGNELFAGSYNLSINAEHGTFENSLHLKGASYQPLIGTYVSQFKSLWVTGDGLLTSLRSEIATSDTIPLVFESMALTWSEFSALRGLIIDNCPAVNSAEYKQNPVAHQTCPRD